MTNAIIRGFRLKDLLNILDARARVSKAQDRKWAALFGAEGR